MSLNPNIDYQNSYLMQSGIGTNFPFSFGQTQCNSRSHSPRQTSLTTPANVPIVCLETSHFVPRSSDHDQQHDTISFEMVDGHQSFHNRNSYPSLGTQCIPLYGHQSLWMGNSFRADETVLSWSLEGSPILAPYQYARNDGHSLHTRKSHNIYSPVLCHDIYGQHNSGLLYQ